MELSLNFIVINKRLFCDKFVIFANYNS